MRKSLIAIAVIIILILAGRMVWLDSIPDVEAVTDGNIFSSLSAKPKKDSLAPDFVLKDINGIDVKLNSLRGTPVVLNFWSVDCAPCLKEKPV